MTRSTYESIDFHHFRNTTHFALSFWCLGLLNNASYVIMLASAKDISEGGTALVFIANIVPSLLIKLSAPYWFEKVSYHLRILSSAALMGTSFLVVATFTTPTGVAPTSIHVALQLIGVALASAQCGLGEASLLALAGVCDALTEKKHCITCFSSGTGLAGVFGFLWKYLWDDLLGFTLKQTLWMAVILVVLYTYVYVKNLWNVNTAAACSLKPPEEGLELVQEEEVEEQDGIMIDNGIPESDCENDTEDAILDNNDIQVLQRVEDMNSRQRLRLVLSLYPYMIPLFLVYAAEYALQSGTWSAIGFPVTDLKARDEFYEYSNWMVRGVCKDSCLPFCKHFIVSPHAIHAITNTNITTTHTVSSGGLFIALLGNTLYSANVCAVAHAHFAMHQCRLLLDRGGTPRLLQLLVVDSMLLCGTFGWSRLCQWLCTNMCRLALGASRVFTQCDKCCRRNWCARGRSIGVVFAIMSLSTQWA